MYDSHQKMCIPNLESHFNQWLNVRNVRRLDLCLTAVSTCVLGLVMGCGSFNIFGGQSGDDGDFKGDDPGGPTVEGPGGIPRPENPGCDVEEVNVEPDEPTSLGLTPAELIASIDPPEAPFHWLDFESSNLSVSQSQGTGTSTLDLDLSLRTDPAELGDDEALIELLPTADSGGVDCGSYVSVPVWVTVRTADGALNARVKGSVMSYGAHIADLYARFRPAQVGGSLSVGEPKSTDDSVTWSLNAFVLNATLWEGGSAGSFMPEFIAKADDVAMGGSTPASSPTSPPPLSMPSSATPVPVALEQREAFGLWPRREECVPGFALDMNDAFMGRSLHDMFATLDAHSSYPLRIETNLTETTPETFDVMLTTEVPSGVVCANVTLQLGTMSLDVAGHLSAATSAPDALALDTDLQLAITAHVDLADPDAPFTRIDFERKIEDVAVPSARDAFQSQVGIDLTAAPAEYTQIWWTWFGTVSPQTNSTSVTLIVTSPDAELTEVIEQQVAEGGPGFGIGIEESGPVLPGDTLLRGTSAP